MENCKVSLSPECPDKSMTSFSHLRNLLETLKNKKSKNSDFFLTSADQKINIHRIILAAHSKKYQELLKNMQTNELALSFKIKKEDIKLFDAFIDSLYDERVSFSVHNPGTYIEYLSHFDNELREYSFYRYARRMDFTPVQALKVLSCLIMKKYLFTSITRIFDRVIHEVLTRFSHFYLLSNYHGYLMEVPLEVFEYLISHDGNAAEEEMLASLINDYIQVNNVNEEVAVRLYSHIHKCSREIKISESLSSQVRDRISKEIAQKTVYRPGSGWHFMIAISNDESNDFLYYDLRSKTSVDASDITSTHKLFPLHTLLKQKKFLDLEVINGQPGGLHKGKDSDSLPIFQKYENQTWVDCFKTQYHINDFIQSNFRIISVGGLDTNRGTQLIGSAVYGDGPWRMFKALDTKVQSHSLCLVSGTVYRFGGFDSESGVFSTSYSIQLWPTAKEWKQIAPMPERAAYAKAVHYGGKIYLFGGYPTSARSQVNKVNQVYDIENNAWETFPNCGKNFSVNFAYEISGIFYLIGKDQDVSQENNEEEEDDDNDEENDDNDEENDDNDESALLIYTFSPITKEYALHGQINNSYEINCCYGVTFNEYDLMKMVSSTG